MTFEEKALNNEGQNIKHQKLMEIADLIDSLHKTPKYSETGKPMVRVTDVKYGCLNLSGALKVNEDVFKEFSRRYNPEKGDIIITRVGSFGNTAYVENTDFCLGQNTAVIKPNINKKYLYFALNSPSVQYQIKCLSVGSTQKTLSLKAIKSLNIPRLGIVNEKRVAEILGSLDQKIELNNQINQTLEVMAQALFKSWFVDFEPVKAKIEARAAGADAEGVTLAAMEAISGQNAEALAKMAQTDPERYAELKATAELFPEALVDSELGEIPAGWEILKLKDALELAYGKALKKTDRVEGDYPVYGSGGVTGSHNEYLVEGPGIIVGRKGTVGSLYLEHSNFFPIDTVFYVKPLKHFSLFYCFYLLQTLGLENMNTDAAVPGLNRNNAYRLNFASSQSDLHDKFVSIVDPFINTIKNNLSQIERLTTLRDSLLPKLLSGEVSVEDV